MTNRLPENQLYTQGGGMDAIDALICLGFYIVKNSNMSAIAPGKFVLIRDITLICDKVARDIIASCVKEMQEDIEYHEALIQQKGATIEN